MDRESVYLVVSLVISVVNLAIFYHVNKRETALSNKIHNNYRNFRQLVFDFDAFKKVVEGYIGERNLNKYKEPVCEEKNNS